MRTNIEIDDALLTEAMAASGARTKRQAVEQGLRALVRLERQKGMLKLRGKVNWVGDLEEMRRD